MRFEVTTQIDRPVGDVFAALVDVALLPRWQTGTVTARLEPPGDAVVGARIVQVGTFLGRRFESEAEIIRMEPPHRFTIQVRGGPLPLVADHLLAERDGGTRLTFSGQTQGGGLGSLAGPLVRRGAEREIRGWFRNLKGLLES